MLTNYVVVEGKTIEALQNEVRRMINSGYGWQPLGGVAVAHSYCLLQAMGRFGVRDAR